MPEQQTLPRVVPVAGTERPADVGDVIQIDPAIPWGPCLAIVDKVYSWGVRCFVFVPGSDRRNPGQAPLRVEHAHYSVIGIAAWLPVGLTTHADVAAAAELIAPTAQCPGCGRVGCSMASLRLQLQALIRDAGERRDWDGVNDLERQHLELQPCPR